MPQTSNLICGINDIYGILPLHFFVFTNALPYPWQFYLSFTILKKDAIIPKNVASRHNTIPVIALERSAIVCALFSKVIIAAMLFTLRLIKITSATTNNTAEATGKISR